MQSVVSVKKPTVRAMVVLLSDRHQIGHDLREAAFLDVEVERERDALRGEHAPPSAGPTASSPGPAPARARYSSTASCRSPASQRLTNSSGLASRRRSRTAAASAGGPAVIVAAATSPRIRPAA